MPNIGLKILFGACYKKWAWVQEQLPYTTPAYIAEKVTKLILNYPGYNHNDVPVIWDMFAGLGGDAIHLAKKGCKVYCTEIDPKIHDLLLKNIETFQLTSEIQPFQEDAVIKIPDIDADIVYFDPPWGNSFDPEIDFDFTNIKLDNGIEIIKLLERIHKEKTSKIVIKAPLKCKTFEKLDFLNIQKIIIFRKHHVKFLFCH